MNVRKFIGSVSFVGCIFVLIGVFFTIYGIHFILCHNMWGISIMGLVILAGGDIMILVDDGYEKK